MATEDQRVMALQMANSESVTVDQVLDRAAAYLVFLTDDPIETVNAKKEKDKPGKDPKPPKTDPNAPHPDQSLPQ